MVGVAFRRPEDTLGTVGAEGEKVGVGRVRPAKIDSAADELGFAGGVDDGRSELAVVAALLLGWISPLAVASLFVKDDIAQPAHPDPDPGCGVLMRGALEPAASGGGKTLSGRVCPYLRMR